MKNDETIEKFNLPLYYRRLERRGESNGWPSPEIFIKFSPSVTRISTDESINEKDEGTLSAGDAINWKSSWSNKDAFKNLAHSVPETFSTREKRPTVPVTIILFLLRKKLELIMQFLSNRITFFPNENAWIIDLLRGKISRNLDN